MTINDRDVRNVLHRVTDHLSSPPGLLDEVRRGGRRRVIRRRTVLAAVCAAVVAVPVGGALRLPTGGGTIEVASPLLDEPTKGDLAGDDAYLRQVRESWQHQLGRSTLAISVRGEPHIVWAGSTPAGPAAYVAQRTATDPIASEPAGDRVIALAAFVEPTANGPQVKTLETVHDAGVDGNTQATFLGPQRDVLLIRDTGWPVEFSPELRYTPDGRIDRTYQRVAFKDGAAVLPVPPQRTKITVGLSRTPVSQDNAVHIDGAMDIIFPEGNSRPDLPRLNRTLPGAEQVWGGDPSDPSYSTDRLAYEVDAGPEALAAYIDAAGIHTHDGSPRLYVYGATPDGRRLLLETIQYDNDPARVIALLARGSAPFAAVASAFADWSAPLPVRLRLPDDQGILVAAEGASLSYRRGAGRWHEAGRDAALLPADATEVRVSRSSGTVTVPIDS